MKTDSYPIESDEDLNQLRDALRSVAKDCDFSDYEITKLVTSASEISRNILNYAGAGEVHLEFQGDQPDAIQLSFTDEGPGIEDVDRAMEDGYSGKESSGLGVGLPGAERLADEFEIKSTIGEGTTVTLVIRREQVQ